MRSWKTPALLATMGLCGLGSLFAQDTLLPSPFGAAPVNGTVQTQAPMPSVTVPAPMELAPTPDSLLPVQTTPNFQPSPVYSPSPVMNDTWMPGPGYSPAPATNCGCAAPAPQYMSAPCQSAPCQGGCGGVAMMAGPVSSCGCRGGAMMSGGYGPSGYGQYGGAGYSSMGSGSGVSSGILSPNANSGGLHTRYPYYNYRHPWFYQGPPSQNVTIVW